VSHFGRHDPARDCSVADGRSKVLADGPYFGAAWCAASLPVGLPLVADWQVVVVSGSVTLHGVAYVPGQAFHTANLAGVGWSTDATFMLAWPVQEAMAQAA
jgi:hypothetical protein